MGILSEGQLIFNDIYEVERYLGEGAFAEVYRVRHRFLGRQAMKVFKSVGMTIDEIEYMLAEAVMLSRIGHPNIVRVFDANILDTPNGMSGFFTMEYVAGGSLEKYWQSHGVQFIPSETAVEIMRQICQGLSIAHSEQPPIIHRDIKPQNILVGYDVAGLRVKVSDFGLAKQVNPLTLMASAKGTRVFKAPEVFPHFQNDSCAGDVWALGTILYLLLTDRLPFPGLGELDLLDTQCFSRPIIPPSRLNIQVDPLLDQIALKSLALKPEDRYPTSKELLAELEIWKPSPSGTIKHKEHSPSSDTSKAALGIHSPADEETAREMAAQAIDLAHQVGKLIEAADLMEEAFNKWPGLRKTYEYRVTLWRNGKIY